MDIRIKGAIYASAALSLFLAGWMVNGWRWEAKYADQLEKSIKTQQTLQEAADEEAIRFFKESQRIIDQRDSAIDRLRNRPERLPEDARANCKGVSGAELARPDGQFLVWFASQAEIQRQALITCYATYDRVRADINGE